MHIDNNFSIITTSAIHERFAPEICRVISESAKIRGTGIARRKPEYIRRKIRDGNAVIALYKNSKFAGFCYIECWGKEKDFLANSGLIVHPDYRGQGLGNKIKEAVFRLSRTKFPRAKLFGITTSPAVMKINYRLGYRPVAISQLTDEDDFWNGCSSCPNYDILQRTGRKHCLCTAMLYDPKEKIQIAKNEKEWHEKLSA
jgi:GNAT superfamily N-acetyltransferase